VNARCGYNYSRDLGQAPFADEAADCGLPAEWHLLFGDGSTGLACRDHRAVMASANSAPDDDHLLGTWCGQPGTLWVRSPPSSCVPSGDRLGLIF
jgi:hypothetical protein